jgi:hypothetical protein
MVIAPDPVPAVDAPSGEICSPRTRETHTQPHQNTPDDIKIYQHGLLVHHAIHHMRQIQSHICFSFPFSGCSSLASSLAMSRLECLRSACFDFFLGGGMLVFLVFLVFLIFE